MTFKLKKRVILTILLTILMLFLSHKLWLTNKYFEANVNTNIEKTERLKENSLQFEIELFVIILVLSGLFGYKIMDYIADFATIKNKSRIDIIFLSIFFTLLFIPMSNISQEQVSKKKTEL